MELETVEVENPRARGDYIRINAVDFDPEKHRRRGDAALPKRTEISASPSTSIPANTSPPPEPETPRLEPKRGPGRPKKGHE